MPGFGAVRFRGPFAAPRTEPRGRFETCAELRTAPTRTGVEGFGVRCTGFEPVVTVWSQVSRRQKPVRQFQTTQLVNFTVIVYYKYKTTTNN